MRANSEFEIEQFIWDKLQSNYNDLNERGLELNGTSFYRQLELPGCGVPDLVGFSCTRENDIFYVEIHIYELKKGRVDGNCLTQLFKYMSFFVSNQEKIEKVYGRKLEFSVYGYLIGSDFDKQTLSLNSIGGAPVEFIRYYIGIEYGISFETVSADYSNNLLGKFLPQAFFEWLDRTPDDILLSAAPENSAQPSQSSDDQF